MSKPTNIGDLRVTVQIVRRVTLPPQPFSAEANHTFTPVLTTRAKVDTKQGVSEFNRVTIADKTVTHVFTIRFTTILFDVRDRVRDALGVLYEILSVEHVALGRRWMKIHCVQSGGSDRESVT